MACDFWYVQCMQLQNLNKYSAVLYINMYSSGNNSYVAIAYLIFTVKCLPYLMIL